MTGPVLQCQDILVTAAGRAILDVERFTVQPAESVALVGANGAGKTTLLHVAALLRKPDAGTVSILGDVATPENAAVLRRSLSLVFQEPLLFNVTVLANAAAGLRFQGQPRAEAERRARSWLERFGVSHLAGRKPRGLSGGEASRVALARAFATEPALLLLDEPFSALDVPTRATLLPALRARLHEASAAAVLVTHDLEEAFAFADRVVLMEAGQIIASGAAPELIARPPSRRAAELLGIETILRATVTRVEGPCAFLALPSASGAVEVRVQPSLQLRAGQPVTFTLPASATRLLSADEPPPTGWNALPGRVSAAVPYRWGTRVIVDTPAPIVTLAAGEAALRRWRSGDDAIVAFRPEAAHVIPE